MSFLLPAEDGIGINACIENGSQAGGVCVKVGGSNEERLEACLEVLSLELEGCLPLCALFDAGVCAQKAEQNNE
jgi:hypothetical protein